MTFCVYYYIAYTQYRIFDLEIALVYPVAVSLNAVGSYGF